MLKRLWVSFATWLLTTKLWYWLARSVIAHFTFRIWGYPKFDMDDYHKIAAIVKNANPRLMFCFVGADKASLAFKLDHLVSGCEWGHAGFVIYDHISDTIKMWHMKGNGLQVWDLLDYLREVDNFALMQVSFPTEEALNKAWNRFYKVSQGGADYDYKLGLDFNFVKNLDDPNSEPVRAALYCSEYVWAVCYGLAKGDTWEPNLTAGFLAFEPDDLHKCGIIKFEGIYE